VDDVEIPALLPRYLHSYRFRWRQIKIGRRKRFSQSLDVCFVQKGHKIDSQSGISFIIKRNPRCSTGKQ
jgi:hypothetical protein